MSAVAVFAILLFIFVWLILAILFKKISDSIIVYIGVSFLISILVVPFASIYIKEKFNEYQDQKLVAASNFPDIETLRKAEKFQIYDYEHYQEYLRELEEKRKRIEAEKKHQQEMAELKNQWEKLEEQRQCRKNAECTGKKHYGTAATYCQREIERRAKYKFEWNDGWGLKFPLMYWLSSDKKVIVYAGDRLQLQNGFGAMQNYIYRCAYNT